MAKNLPANAGDPRDAGWTPGLGKSPEGGKSIPAFFLGSLMDRGAGRLWSMGLQTVVHD